MNYFEVRINDSWVAPIIVQLTPEGWLRYWAKEGSKMQLAPPRAFREVFKQVP